MEDVKFTTEDILVLEQELDRVLETFPLESKLQLARLLSSHKDAEDRLLIKATYVLENK